MDLSFLLDPPAGKDGFIRVEGGHLVRPDGKRFRIWGVNITMGAAFPSPQDAPVVAASLARIGLNCVRFHFLDIPAPRGFLATGRDDTRALDPERLDRFDRLVAELKLRGIYANLNLNVGRRYRPGDGVRDAELLGVAKGATYFDPRLMELQKQYARDLLTHRNPYTGNEYRSEPAVAIVELLNENSLIEAWFSGRLRGEADTRPNDVWSDVPRSYAEALTERFNAWLRMHRSEEEIARIRAEAGAEAEARAEAGVSAATRGAIPRLRPEEFAKASKARFGAEAEFLMDVEREYFAEMARTLREELGVRVPIAGSSDHNHGRSGYAHTAGLATLDLIDGHVYWQHPSYVRDPKGGKTGFTIPNTPMVDDPNFSTVAQLSRTPVLGRPYTVSEFNHPFPNEYASEGLPILAAYGAFQDWDGFFAYTLAHDDLLALRPVVKGHFDHAMDPVKVAELSACALIFLRADVRPAERTVARAYTREEVIESIRLYWRDRPFFTPGFPPTLPLRHAVRVSSFDRTPNESLSEEPAGGTEPIRSDTGELEWRRDGGRLGLVKVDAERAQALVGFVGRRASDALRARTRHLDAAASPLSPEFCALILVSLDGLPIARSERMLLVAGARVENAGMRWSEKRTSLEDWGGEPTRIEPVRGRLLIGGLEGARELEAQAMDGAGRPLGEPVEASGSDSEGWALPLGRPPSPWYAIFVRR